ncbi:contactin-5, partial [Tachysurus ichikawai]
MLCLPDMLRSEQKPWYLREGRRIRLECHQHSSEIIYSWVFNEFPSFVAEDSRRFVSQQTGNLYISKVQPSDVGSYICLVKNTVTNARVLSPPTPLTLRTDDLLVKLELFQRSSSLHWDKVPCSLSGFLWIVPVSIIFGAVSCHKVQHRGFL